MVFFFLLRLICSFWDFRFQLHTVCIPRAFILAAVWGKHGTSSGGRSVFVLDGLAQISRRVHPLFVLCSPEDFTPRPFKLTVVWGTHGTSSGGHSVFLGQFERGKLLLLVLLSVSLLTFRLKFYESNSKRVPTSTNLLGYSAIN